MAALIEYIGQLAVHSGTQLIHGWQTSILSQRHSIGCVVLVDLTDDVGGRTRHQ